MPAFVWSPNSGMLSSPNIEITQSFSSSDVVSLVKYAAGESDKVSAELTHLLPSDRPKPEMVLVFVYPRLNTADVSRYSSAFDPESQGGVFANLKAAMESSGSALSLPYVYRTAEDDILTELGTGANIHTVDAEDAPAFLAGKPVLLHDKKADVLVIKFGDAPAQRGDALRAKLASDDKLMAQIVAKTNAATEGDFLAVLTANAPSDSPALKRASAIAQEQQQWMQLQTSTRLKKSSSSSSSYLYTTPGILSGLLVSLVLLIILSIGVFAMMALDTPDSFEGEGGYLKGS